jgi:hypothetical protein
MYDTTMFPLAQLADCPTCSGQALQGSCEAGAATTSKQCTHAHTSPEQAIHILTESILKALSKAYSSIVKFPLWVKISGCAAFLGHLSHFLEAL